MGVALGEGTKEGRGLFNDALSTFYYGYVASEHMVTDEYMRRSAGRGKEGRVLFNDALGTFYYGYMASDIW